MSKLDFSRRTADPEIMDEFDLQGKELEQTLADLERVNALLGGNQVTIKGIKKLLAKSEKQEIIIADVGCGSGAMLRKIADFGRKNNYNFKLIGIDANKHTIEIARNLSEIYPEIEFKPIDIFSEEFQQQQFDICTCTLTMHHFQDDEIVKILNSFNSISSRGVVINDLHRSPLAYHLFKAFCFVFIRNEIARKDGLVSIRRGFIQSDFKKYYQKLNFSSEQLSWEWAFRFLWILKK